jgi:hypothetical protein
MLGFGKTGTGDASAAASLARSRDIYQYYAAALYWQALLTHHDSAPAEQVISDVLVNERALANLTGRRGGRRYRGPLSRGPT